MAKETFVDRNFTGASLDAIEPRALASIVTGAIQNLRDDIAWTEAIDKEKVMRDELFRFAREYRNGNGK